MTLRSPLRLIIAAVAVFTIGALTTGLAQTPLPRTTGAGGRAALVIGNQAYPNPIQGNPVNDARSVADALRQVGFEVTLRENLPRAELRQAISTFSQAVKPDGVALLYFSGFGIQAAGQNYIAPVDAELTSIMALQSTMINTATILQELNTKAPALRVMVLDVARKNPFGRSVSGLSTGLAAGAAPPGALLAYATEPGKIVPESVGVDNLFTQELVAALRTPGVSITDAFQHARTRVSLRTGAEQVPWISSQVTAVAAAPTATGTPGPSAPAPTTPGAPADSDQVFADAFELAFWDTIKTSTNPADFRAYLQAYPNGRFAPLARLRAGIDAIPPAPPTPAPTSQTVGEPNSRFFRDCPDCPEMVVISAGSFDMGANDTFEFERPRHRVTLSRDFAIGRREVTFAEWDTCVQAGACKPQPDDRGWGRGDRPVINLSWTDAQSYTGWLAQRTGKRYRLPTEAEWEYAARAGTNTAYWWGREPGTGRANCTNCGSSFQGQTAPTGSFEANPLGLFDTAGNAAEWVEDCWQGSFRGAPTNGAAWISPRCTERVLRGGSFTNAATYARSSGRFKYDPDVRYYANGFRVARDLP